MHVVKKPVRLGFGNLTLFLEPKLPRPATRLLKKVRAHGIEDKLYNWIRAWLKDRWQRRNPWAFCRQGSRRRCPGHPLSPVSPSGCSPPAQHSHLQYNQSTNQIWHLMNFSKQPNTRATSTSKQWSLQGSGEDPECFDSDPDPTFHIDSDLNPNFILFLWKFGSYKIQIHKSTYFRFSTFKFYFISNQYRYRYGILCLHEGWANFILIVIPPNMIRIRLLTRGEKMESLSGKML